MKKLLIFILVSLYLNSCQDQDQVGDLKITYQEIDINIPGKPIAIQEYKNKFYAIFDPKSDSLNSDFNFYILNAKGNVDRKMSLPDNRSELKYDLYVKNDSICIIALSDSQPFYIDLNNYKWIKIKKQKDLYFEDDKYEIFSRDFGEWGGVTWFKNKQTQQQFELEATNPKVNALNDFYYLTQKGKILEIQNPEVLEKSLQPYDFEKVIGVKNYLREGSISSQGVNTLYTFSDYSEFNYNNKNEFVTSFISKNKLYHIYKDSLSTKIATINQGNLMPIYTFKGSMTPKIGRAHV